MQPYVSYWFLFWGKSYTYSSINQNRTAFLHLQTYQKFFIVSFFVKNHISGNLEISYFHIGRCILYLTKMSTLYLNSLWETFQCPQKWLHTAWLLIKQYYLYYFKNVLTLLATFWKATLIDGDIWHACKGWVTMQKFRS